MHFSHIFFACGELKFWPTYYFWLSFQEKCLSQSNEIKSLTDLLLNAQEKLQVTRCDFLTGH